jgi:hypothetical protein
LALHTGAPGVGDEKFKSPMSAQQLPAAFLEQRAKSTQENITSPAAPIGTYALQ